LNTRALTLTRIHEKYPNLVDVESGIVREDAVYHAVESILGMLNIEEIIRDAVREVWRHGIAGVSSMSCPPSEARALASLEKKGELRIRVACYPRREHLEEVIYILENTRNIMTVGVKDFADGSLGARTAYLRSPYEDSPATRGKRLLTADELRRIGLRILDLGLRLAVHAIGDAALDEVIEAYASLEPGERARVEHASVAWDEQLDKLSTLGVYVVVQPLFRVSDWWIEKRLGKRALLAYRFKSMVKHGVKIALSSDSPVEDYDPVKTFRAALGDCEGVTCRSEEALSPREAIRAYTIISSRASGGPVSRVGRLERGALALLSWSPEYPLTTRWRGPLYPLDFKANEY